MMVTEPALFITENIILYDISPIKKITVCDRVKCTNHVSGHYGAVTIFDSAHILIGCFLTVATHLLAQNTTIRMLQIELSNDSMFCTN